MDEEFNEDTNNVYEIADEDDNSNEELLVCASGSKSNHRLSQHKHCSDIDRHYVSRHLA